MGTARMGSQIQMSEACPGLGATASVLRIAGVLRIIQFWKPAHHDWLFASASNRKTARASSRDAACLEPDKTLRVKAPRVSAVGTSPTFALACVVTSGASEAGTVFDEYASAPFPLCKARTSVASLGTTSCSRCTTTPLVRSLERYGWCFTSRVWNLNP